VALVEKAVSQGEARLTGRVLRLTAASRKRLTTDAVAACVNDTLPAAAPSKAALLAALSASNLPAAGPATSVRTPTLLRRAAESEFRPSLRQKPSWLRPRIARRRLEMRTASSVESTTSHCQRSG
jgi:hypothetical protein